MRLKALGSSSAGNCYALQNKEGKFLLLDCGLSFDYIKKGLGFRVSDILGVLVTHEHMDHAKGVKKAMAAGISIYTSAGTARALGLFGHRLKCIEARVSFSVGEFLIMPFDVNHDAAEPLGFLLHHPECGRLLFATDTYYIKYRFENLENILFECNYSEQLLEENLKRGAISPTLEKRIVHSHISLENLEELLYSNALEHLRNIVLLHLSDSNSDEAGFIKRLRGRFGVPVYAAYPGFELDL